MNAIDDLRTALAQQEVAAFTSDEAELALAITRAQIDSQVREALEMAGKKVTEATIANRVTYNDTVIDAETRVLYAHRDLNQAKNAVEVARKRVQLEHAALLVQSHTGTEEE